MTARGRDELERRARAAGILIEPRWGGAADIPDATLETLSSLLGQRPDAPTPTEDAAFVPPFLDERRAWGVSLQLYQLRSPRNLGIGDLRDLRGLIPSFARAGADFVGLNPLHALFTAEPERASPFSPSDRRFLNPLIVAAEDVPGYRPDMRNGIPVPASDDAVDYTAATDAKLAVLRRIHGAWRSSAPDVPAAAQNALARFIGDGGAALADFALFEALSHHMAAEGHGAGWTGWPERYQERSSSAVAAFREAHQNEVAFHLFLQFEAARQLAETQAAARSAGMRLGLYLDLAVGAAPDGAATWADPALAMRGVRVGAPPDLFSNEGQDWGLAPLSPTELLARDLAPYRDVLAAVLGPAGAARIDHAMGLERLYLIPDGASALDGAYVTFSGLTDALVTETRRHQALAIGEDLGVVPVGFRERMGARRIFAMRILPFERDGDVMRPPGAYPADALACLSTHDIAPLEAWWRGDDIDIRVGLGHLTRAHAFDARVARNTERELLLSLAGLPPGGAERPLSEEFTVAIHRAAARSASRLMAIRLEDIVGGRRLVNLPGTDREHPNWRNTLPLEVDAILRSDLLQRVMQAAAEERP